MIATIALAVLLNSPGNDKPAIDAACKQIAIASQSKNWKKLGTLCTSDWVQHTHDGQTIHLSDLEKNLAPLSDLKFSYKVLDVKSNGSKADCRVFWSVKATYMDAKGKHTYQGDDTEIDTFKKVGGKWLQSAVKELTVSAKIDGKLARS